MTTLRDILNRARWASENLHDLDVLVVHRGAPGDQRAIAGSRIVAVLPGGIEVSPDEADGESMFVPYHRFIAIHGVEGVRLWSKAEGANPDAHVTASTDAGTQAAPALRVVESGVEVLPTFSVLLRTANDPAGLVIDGSAGEGGGQILRSSLSLSMLTGTPFTLERIRAGRKKPGLMRQHLTAVKAAAAIANAELEGATLGSTRLVFRPHAIEGGDHELDIGSAGSAALVLQTLALPLALAQKPSRVCVRGGTHALWAPIYPFLEQAWLPLMQRAGAQLSLELHKTGFYPAGGGEVVMTTEPSTALRPLHLEPSVQPLDVVLEAVVAGIPEAIARRELTAAAELLHGTPLELRSKSVRSPGPGNALWLVARASEEHAATNVFSAIGEQGVSAEQVAESVANAFVAWRQTQTSVEEHLSDQVMLPIALAGEGSYTCSGFSLHARTNIEVIHAFTGLRFCAWDLGAGRFRVELGRSSHSPG